MSVPFWWVITTATQWAYEKCAAIWRGLAAATPQLHNAESTAAATILRAEEALAGYLGSLLHAGDGATVTLVAGQTRLSAHAAVLAARSDWFDCKLRLEGIGEVSMPDVEGPVLRQLLAYCYTLRTPQLASMAAQLLAAADKYHVPQLKARCERHLAAQLTVENAAATAILAVRHSCRNLTTAAVTFIRAHNYQVMGTQGWADAIRTEPEDVIRLSQHLANALRDPRSIPEEDRSRWLLRAAECGAVEEVRLLLAAGVDIETREQGEDGEGYTALHWAAECGRLEVVQVLLEAGAQTGSTDAFGDTPLHVAAAFNQTAVVGMLVAASADPNARNYWEETPLDKAAGDDHKEVVAALLEVVPAGGLKVSRGPPSLPHQEG